MQVTFRFLPYAVFALHLLPLCTVISPHRFMIVHMLITAQNHMSAQQSLCSFTTSCPLNVST